MQTHRLTREVLQRGFLVAWSLIKMTFSKHAQNLIEMGLQ
jgi:hypothetical protein